MTFTQAEIDAAIAEGKASVVTSTSKFNKAVIKLLTTILTIVASTAVVVALIAAQVIDVPVPTPPTTTPPTTVPAPAGGFPDATNTGIPQGTVLTAAGGQTFATVGQIVTNLDINGGVTIAANNVIMRKTRVRCGGCFNVIRVNDGITGFVIEDSEIDGLGGTGGANGLYGTATMTRVGIRGVENGVQPSSGSTIQDSWMHDFASPGAPHFDGVEIDGGRSNIVVQHNSITIPNQTSAVMIDNYFGAIANIVVVRNLLTGGTYTVYVDGSCGGCPGTNVPITGVVLKDNRIGGWQYGPTLIRGNSGPVVQSGNVNNDTGMPL